MARKTMTKEVTSTNVKLAKMVMVDGSPSAETLPDEILIGNVTLENAQKHVTKKHGVGVTVFAVEPKTDVYEMSVEEFIKVATLRKDEPVNVDAPPAE
jgi:hypothetical protein